MKTQIPNKPILGKRGLNGAELKYIAILAMLLDHISFLFIDPLTVTGQAMRFVGRITAPVMAFFLTEGYHYTHDLRKYFSRLIVFAVISQAAFTYCFFDEISFFNNGSVIVTLTLSLLAVHIYNSKKIDKAFKLPLILIIAFFAEYSDCGSTLVLFVLSFELGRGDRKKQILAYAVTALYSLLPIIISGIKGNDSFSYSIFKFGAFLPAFLLLFYNGEKGGGKYTKWVFYVFYPLHLAFLAYINSRV